MGIRLLKGRVFTEADTAGKPAVTVINQTLAARLWPGDAPEALAFFTADRRAKLLNCLTEERRAARQRLLGLEIAIGDLELFVGLRRRFF